jgi:hypothetical protein
VKKKKKKEEGKKKKKKMMRGVVLFIKTNGTSLFLSLDHKKYLKAK